MGTEQTEHDSLTSISDLLLTCSLSHALAMLYLGAKQLTEEYMSMYVCPTRMYLACVLLLPKYIAA